MSGMPDKFPFFNQGEHQQQSGCQKLDRNGIAVGPEFAENMDKRCSRWLTDCGLSGWLIIN
jgi:hypothetical protein